MAQNNINIAHPFPLNYFDQYKNILNRMKKYSNDGRIAQFYARDENDPLAATLYVESLTTLDRFFDEDLFVYDDSLARQLLNGYLTSLACFHSENVVFENMDTKCLTWPYSTTTRDDIKTKFLIGNKCKFRHHCKKFQQDQNLMTLSKFAPPEYFAGQIPWDESCDVFAFAAMFFFIMMAPVDRNNVLKKSKYDLYNMYKNMTLQQIKTKDDVVLSGEIPTGSSEGLERDPQVLRPPSCSRRDRTDPVLKSFFKKTIFATSPSQRYENAHVAIYDLFGNTNNKRVMV